MTKANHVGMCSLTAMMVLHGDGFPCVREQCRCFVSMLWVFLVTNGPGDVRCHSHLVRLGMRSNSILHGSYTVLWHQAAANVLVCPSVQLPVPSLEHACMFAMNSIPVEGGVECILLVVLSHPYFLNSEASFSQQTSGYIAPAKEWQYLKKFPADLNQPRHQPQAWQA